MRIYTELLFSNCIGIIENVIHGRFDFFQGQLEVRLADPHYSNQIDLRDQSFYQMVETTAYFEAYRHVLDGLQVIEPRRFPFKVSIICSLVCSILQKV